ncbi:MAG: conjugal transfer protein TraH [Candidatus Thiodubiliella endoseptemdiera]|uniref:Conjugal transfer protein TraH n=1 Tax=Candidatus Thiodubiliella endoseptemdiera TaxID=2738886 RepID=A0A853F5N3_9GAMM|nr:conjugal transfer protein TraH [Candidatus Thiodubiliella endoseptemdiera]
MKNLKNYFNIYIIILLSMLGVNVNAGWVDDWAAQSTRSGPNYFEGQKRGYFNAGSYNARFRNSQENLFSIQKPRLKSGCGGIDLFMGGFSFMDPEYLMQKMQRALQMAPAIAFDLALKELMAEGAASLGKFEGIINQLNKLQLSECGIAKDAVNAVRGKFDLQSSSFSEVASLFDSEQSINDSSSKNSVNSQELQKNNDNKPTKEQKKTVEGCSAEFKAVFTKDGSVLKHIAQNKGMEAYADFMRAYLGDVIIKYADKQYGNTPVEKCPDVNVLDVDGIVNGTAKIRPIVGSCTNSADKAIHTLVKERLTSIATKVKTRAAFTTDEENFLNSVPFDNLNTIKRHVLAGSDAFYIDQYKEIIARDMAYAMVDDIVNKIAELQEIAVTQAKTANTGANAKTCDIAIVTPIIESVSNLGKKAKNMQKAIRQKRNEYIKQLINRSQFNVNITGFSNKK